MPRKLGVNSAQRKAILRNQASNLLWYGRIETTLATAKEVRSYTEKIITLAMNTYEDTVEEKITTKNAKGKDVTKTVIKDGAKKLAARRKIMTLTYDFQEQKGFKESKPAFKARTKDIRHPLMEKIFNEIAPKYAERKKKCGRAADIPHLQNGAPQGLTRRKLRSSN